MEMYLTKNATAVQWQRGVSCEHGTGLGLCPLSSASPLNTGECDRSTKVEYQ